MPVRGKALARYIKKDPWIYIHRFLRGGLALVNVSANAAGVVVCIAYFLFLDDITSVRQIPYYLLIVASVFVFMAALATVRTQLLVKDIVNFVRLNMQGEEAPPELAAIARQKILSMPFISITNSTMGWLVSTLFIAGIRFCWPPAGETAGEALLAAVRIAVGMLVSGAVTCVIVFFASEINMQYIWPYFFPEGDMVKTKNVRHFKIRTRLLLNTLVASVIPLVVMAVIFYTKTKMMLVIDQPEVMASLFNLSVFLLLTSLCVSIILTHMLGHTIVDPVESLAEAMEKVEKGDLEAEVSVTSLDELGVLSYQFNQMTQGLKEREELRHSLLLAKEVQQSLIPRFAPEVLGLDIAGQCLYCDDTGGDYYDYLDFGKNGEIGLAVGDVSGHGVSSALLMASVRAYFRQRAALPGDLGQVVTDVNQQLTRDVGESGQFMTFLCCRISAVDGTIAWANAGHDPAIVHDPHSNEFNELSGRGPALGLVEKYPYIEYSVQISPGQVFLIGTDGLWEARDPNNQPFGKDRLRDLILLHRNETAEGIKEAVIEALINHRGPLAPEDDVTLVVVKVGAGIKQVS